MLTRLKMNRRTTLFALSVCSFSLSLSSCITDGADMHKSTAASLYYQNETKADTEEYNFLRSVYRLANDEIEFAKVINDRATSPNVKSLAQKISAQFKEIQTKVTEMGTQAHVLVPYPGMSNFELANGLDSAQGPVLEKAYIERSLHNQESIIHQFMTVEENTKKSTSNYAEEVLPVLEKNLEETKALL